MSRRKFLLGGEDGTNRGGRGGMRMSGGKCVVWGRHPGAAGTEVKPRLQGCDRPVTMRTSAFHILLMGPENKEKEQQKGKPLAQFRRKSFGD